MTALRVAVLDVLLLAAGLGVLRGLGLVACRRDLLRLAGLGFLVGFATVGVLLSALLAAGLGDGVWLVALLACALSALGIRRVRGTLGVAPARSRWELVSAAAAAAVGGVYLAVLLRAAGAGAASSTWDAWAFWVPKAKTIYYFGGLDAGTGGIAAFANPDYPPLLPALDATVFAFAGHARAALLPVQEWLLVAAFAWAVAGLLWRRVRLDALAVALLLVLLMPDLAETVGSSLGDLPLALLVGTAALCLALWLVDADAALLVVGALLLAAAAVTKKEGLSLALLLLLAVLLCAGLRRWRGLALAALGVVGAVVPWRLWLRAHDVVTSGDYRLRDALSPAYLEDHADRAGTAAPRVASTLFDPHHWGLVLPLALAAAVALLPRRRRLAALPLAFVGLGYLGLVAVYWISLLPIRYHLDTSVDRTVMPIVLVGGALLPLLLGEAVRPEQRLGRAPEPVLEADRGLEAERLPGG